MDLGAFSGPSFDANEYANTLIPPVGKDDVGTALAKLNFGIDDVAQQLKALVSEHHHALLAQAAGIGDLEGSISSVKTGLDEVTNSLEKLGLKIRTPYQNLASHVVRLDRLQQATDVLRRTARFVILARRLQSQMLDFDKAPQSTASAQGTLSPKAEDASEDTNYFGVEGEKERSIAKAALSVAELVALLDEPEGSEQPPAQATEFEDEDESPGANNARRHSFESARIPLRAINLVNRHIPAVEAARVRVSSEMESMVLQGLSTLNQALLASSLQTAYNLHVLPQLVQSLVSDLSDAVDARIRAAFDLARLSKDVSAKEPPSSSSLVYKSRLRTEPTNLTAPQWTAALWARLETLIEELAGCCIKVYTLERVLRLKKDPATQSTFLEEALKVLENKPTSTFWGTLSRALEKNCKDAAKGSTFIQQTLSTGYPRFLRLFHEFFAKIAVHTDTVYAQQQQSPETIVTLRSVSHFEGLYLSRVTARLNEAAASALANVSRGSPPGAADGVTLARAYANELDAARFDPLLVRAVARVVGNAVDSLSTRVEGLVQKDRSATTLLGPSVTPQQVLNAQLVSFMYHCEGRLVALEGEYPEQTAAIFAPSIKNLRGTYLRATDPLLQSIRREVSAILARLHRVALGKGLDNAPSMGGGASPYMKELVDKLAFVRGEPLARFAVGELMHEWVAAIVRHVIRTFVLHVSIARPLGESGKLQLTSDMTELEFALDAFMKEPASAAKKTQQKPVKLFEAVGEEYRMLRALRPLLFLDNEQLTSQATQGLPPLVVLHHIFVRSPMPLPHTLHGWHEAEYVKWVEEHTPAEAWTLVEGGLSHWEKLHDSAGNDGAKEYIDLARKVLENARAGDI